MNESGPNVVRAVRVEKDTVVAAIEGEIDLSTSPALREVLLNLVEQHRPGRMVVNLEGVPYMDSSALAVLVELVRRLGKAGRVVLTNLQPRVRGLLQIARLDSIFAIASSEQEAMAK